MAYPKYLVNSVARERKRKTKPRLCLRCIRLFNSLGPENRICPRCSGRAPDSGYRNSTCGENRDW